LKLKIPYYKIIISIVISAISIEFYAQEIPKIGLVLSGGGAKGIAHIGAIRALEHKGIKPDYIVGTSMGALIGGMYAIGYSPDDIEIIIKNIDWEYLLNDEIKRSNYLIDQKGKNRTCFMSFPLDGIKPKIPSGLFAGDNILALIEIITRNYSREVNFDDLPIPFRCIGTNIETGTEKVFSNNRLSDALRASMSIPSVFKPYEIDEELYIDGGLVNNFPTDVATSMGAEIIIGVDVGSSPNKKEDINTIVKVLSQATSFYNYKIAKKNKALCSIYIRPDITDISLLGFDDVTNIIDRGFQATIDETNLIDSIFENFNLQPILGKNCINPSFQLDSVIVNINIKREKDVTRLITRKLSLKKNSVFTNQKLANKVNRIYASNYFEQISLTFQKKDSSNYNVHLKIKEKKQNEIEIGLRFDNQFGINPLIKTNFKNLLIYGSSFEVGIVPGQSPQLKLQYTTDRGSGVGIGSLFIYDKFEVFTYQNSIKENTLFYRRAKWNLFTHTNIGNANLILLGLEASVFTINASQQTEDIFNFIDKNFNLFLSYQVDTWDRSYYPNKGFNLKARGDIIKQNDASLLNTIWLRANSIIPMSKKFKIIPEGFIGIGSLGVDSSNYRFETGGLSKNKIEWHNSFPGLQFLEHNSSNIWIASASSRYEFRSNHFLTYMFAVASLTNSTANLFSKNSTIYKGMSLKYGWLNRFGPFECTIDYSLDNKNSYTFLSFGYWF